MATSVAFLLIVAACGAEADSAETTTPAETTNNFPTSTAAEVAGDTVGSTTTSTVLVGGVEVDFGPPRGAAVAVVGVAHDDVLNLREGPGISHGVVATIEPLTDGLRAEGHTRQLDNSAWTAVDHDGKSGWVNLSYVAYLSQPTDETASVVEHLGSSIRAESVETLGREVAALYVSEDPPSTVVISRTPSPDEPNVIVIDVIGLGDDSVFGIRLRVSAEPMDRAFNLLAVEVTHLCDRGVSDGLCV